MSQARICRRQNYALIKDFVVQGHACWAEQIQNSRVIFSTSLQWNNCLVTLAVVVEMKSDELIAERQRPPQDVQIFNLPKIVRKVFTAK